jgi:hypothetical protein
MTQVTWVPRSDLWSQNNDRLGDDAHADVVVAGVPAHELVGLIYRDRVVLDGDSLWSVR